MDTRIQFVLKTWHRMIAHSHEIVVALMVEGSRMNLIFLLLTIALVCIAFVVQVAFAQEGIDA